MSHQFALDGRWTQVDSQIAPTDQDREDSARHTNQIRAFYEASASTLWITFVTHSLIDADVAKQSASATRSSEVSFWGSRSIALRAAHSGLAQWLIDKAT